MKLLEGVKVIDFTHAYAGPYCSLELGDFGAEVIKIERPDTGDQARLWGPFKNCYSAYYSSFNRGKRSLTLNLTSKEGKNIVFDLVRNADIVISNFKSGTLEKYGLGYDELKQVNPEVIFAAINGFGRFGKYAKFAAYDNVIQAMAGIMDMTGFPDKTPTKIGPAIGDSYSGLMLLVGVLLAYYNKLKTGKGQRVDVSMLGSLVSMAEYPVLEYANFAKKISRIGNVNPYYAPGDIYKCADGYIAISVKKEVMWMPFCEALNLTIANDNRFVTNDRRLANVAELKKIIETAIEDKTRREIVDLLTPAGIAAAGVINIAESFEDSQLKARDMVISLKDPGLGPIKLVGNPIKLSKNPPVTNIPSPLLGEHTDEVLRELGYTDAELVDFHSKNIV
ncbi:CoA transferase [Megasphaera paucivorans]|uniref:CoA:oxalate CoA-transferase n=1 Tax=Megasphaera paucivorans TaxID=349095 RepID=A0A1G9QDA6_9FIRM|nr:CoA transferase [Megasphaera paucivorans]SDM08979.1 CoA:oxalate CoA-transferase [Megasphaera paucivorans]